jgi:integrase
MVDENKPVDAEIVRQSAGELQGPGVVPVVAFLSRYRSKVSERAMRDSLMAVSRAIGAPGPEAVAWHLLRYEHTQAIFKKLSQTHGAPSLRRHLVALRGVLRSCSRMRGPDGRPLLSREDLDAAIDLPKVEGSREVGGRMLVLEEQRKLFTVARRQREPRRSRDLAIVGVALATGMRRDGIASVALKGYNPGEATLTFIGKRDKQQTVPLPPEVNGFVRAWCKLRGAGEGPLFLPIQRSGAMLRRQLTGEGVVAILRALGKAAGLAHFSPHDFRRTCASELLDDGADLLAVQELLGHEDPATTARYDRRGFKKVRKVVDARKLPTGEEPS